MKASFFVLFLFFNTFAMAQASDSVWSENFPIPDGGRPNPLSISQDQWPSYVQNGQVHAQVYPVTVTGLLPPIKAVQEIFAMEPQNPLKIILSELFEDVTSFHSLNDALRWVGLHPYPQPSEKGVYAVAYPPTMGDPHPSTPPDYLMGFGYIQRNGAMGFSLSCATCHSGNLFGKTVLGLTNRFPRANQVFVIAKKFLPYVSPRGVGAFEHLTPAETDLLVTLKSNFKNLDVRPPIQFGMDDALRQVSLSLAVRNDDDWATPSPYFQAHPRPDLLDDFAADSKPSVWWNLKYKDRWLSDGSVVSGNPVFTNILWNEIGRGADLMQIEEWLTENTKAVEELTSAVFATEAPRITDFFPAEKIPLDRAKNGERLFLQTCAKCHGSYEKGWSQPGSDSWALADQIKTVKVHYTTTTHVHNVGTDPQRFMGMKALEKLNKLAISKANNTVVQAQNGYVPPPLVGIWARWPYLHNNSVPSLKDLLTASSQRPKAYYAGEANDPGRDFDFTANGYPEGNSVPTAWVQKNYLYDTTRAGMSNRGHDEGIFLDNGTERFSPEEKADIVYFLQTL